ncbi:MAG: hypothetical protein P8184_11045 [Calditrichia bacterium]
MKIYNSTNKVYQNPGLNRINQKPAAEEAAVPKSARPERPYKLNIPENIQDQLTLSKKEQQFFEKLYPRARKEIQRYAESQNNVQAEKGKFVDMRG